MIYHGYAYATLSKKTLVEALDHYNDRINSLTGNFNLGEANFLITDMEFLQGDLSKTDKTHLSSELYRDGVTIGRALEDAKQRLSNLRDSLKGCLCCESGMIW